eukprot:CAMPEP_0116576944 /NCGR_PEP_ID=MMETSP0397-20121206/20842_1 /TAXON_ID=216820 /ORGANISM="Cyclophora tenuis, Strain ECT3854" /LENGTH=227 /DNA_ID=CAMNT_0004106099 /DNA_START=456 /DNA_END=1139 /DNA_ORIENTATION=+
MLQDVATLARNNPSFRYFVFTNLKDLNAPGWIPITKNLDGLTRMITKSRYGKFLAWKDALLTNCEVVFYLDGWYTIHKSSVTYRRIANEVKSHPSGMGQYLHPSEGGITREMEKIVRLRKDTAENMNKTIAWLKQQPDFSENCTLYTNYAFAYSIESSSFQKSSQFFWETYSTEDASWRDQPLWCYVLDHLNVTPMKLTTNLFQPAFERMGHAGHKYTSRNSKPINV